MQRCRPPSPRVQGGQGAGAAQQPVNGSAGLPRGPQYSCPFPSRANTMQRGTVHPRAGVTMGQDSWQSTTCPEAGGERQGHVELTDPLPLLGPCPTETWGTRSHFPVSSCLQASAWSAAVEQQDGTTLSLSLCSPPDARIGLYTLTMEASTGYQGTSFRLGDFILLFNPWCPGEAFGDASRQSRGGDGSDLGLTQLLAEASSQQDTGALR